jgi:hypothetical protein
MIRQTAAALLVAVVTTAGVVSPSVPASASAAEQEPRRPRVVAVTDDPGRGTSSLELRVPTAWHGHDLVVRYDHKALWRCPPVSLGPGSCDGFRQGPADAVPVPMPSGAQTLVVRIPVDVARPVRARASLRVTSITLAAIDAAAPGRRLLSSITVHTPRPGDPDRIAFAPSAHWFRNWPSDGRGIRRVG